MTNSLRIKNISNTIEEHKNDIIICFLKHSIIEKEWTATQIVLIEEFQKLFKLDKEMVYDNYNVIVDDIFSILENCCDFKLGDHETILMGEHKGSCVFSIELFEGFPADKDVFEIIFFVNDNGEEYDIYTGR